MCNSTVVALILVQYDVLRFIENIKRFVKTVRDDELIPAVFRAPARFGSSGFN